MKNILICWKDSLTLFLPQNFIPFLKNVFSTSFKTYRTLIIYFWWYIPFAALVFGFVYLLNSIRFIYRWIKLSEMISRFSNILNVFLFLLFPFIILVLAGSKEIKDRSSIVKIIKQAFFNCIVTAIIFLIFWVSYIFLAPTTYMGPISDLLFLPPTKYMEPISDLLLLTGFFFILPLPLERSLIFEKILYQFDFKVGLAFMTFVAPFISPLYLFLNFSLLDKGKRIIKFKSAIVKTFKLIIYAYPINLIIYILWYSILNLIWRMNEFITIIIFVLLLPFIASFMFELYKRNLKIIS